MEDELFLNVKAISGDVIKRFDIPTSSTFEELKAMIIKLFGNYDFSIKFKDEEEDLVTIGGGDEYTEALKSVPKTGNILRVYLMKTVLDNGAVMDSSCPNTSTGGINAKQTCLKKQKLSDASLDENVVDVKKRMVKHKIESASKLSKDLKFISSEVTGRIPPVSEQCLNQHFISQKPGCRKVRRLSSNNGSDKNDRKVVRSRADQQRKKENGRRSSSSISSRSCSSSSQSSSSSSESSQEESQEISKEKKKKSHVILNEMLCKSKSEIESNLLHTLEQRLNTVKKDITTEILHSVLHQLEGAVIQSITTPPPKAGEQVNNKSDEHEDGKTQKVRYHHQNVICDHCENEIFGPRYKCGNCSDYDLCEQCELLEGIHTPSHVFIKMHYPSPCAGRNQAGGKLRPLLRSNIYELREKEREKEDLLQRKFDANSELNHKAIEKMEKQRIKMREAERSREVREARKEEWKRTKKEIKMMRREQLKKLKQQWIEHNQISKPTIESLTDFQYVESNPPDSENKEAALMSIESIEPIEMISTWNNDALQDDILSSAISSLKVVQKSSDDLADINIECTKEFCNDVKKDTEESLLEYDSDNTSSDVMVVKKEDIPSVMQLNNKPDLVDFDKDVLDFTSNDDFVVVPKCFDLNSPLDIEHVHHHHQQHSGDCIADVCFGGVDDGVDGQAKDDSLLIDNSAPAELPVDLVASVQTNVRNQPDITSIQQYDKIDVEHTVSVEKLPATACEEVPGIPFELTTEHKSDKRLANCDLLADPTSQFSLYEPSDGAVTEQPSEEIPVLPPPTLHDEIMKLKKSVDNLEVTPPVTTCETKPKTLLELTLENDISGRVDSITQSQIDRELQLKKKEEEIQSIEAEETSKSKSSFNPPSRKFLNELDKQRQMEVQEAENDPTLTDVITGAMSTIADAAAAAFSNVVSSGRTSSAVEYQGEEESVVIRSNSSPEKGVDGRMGFLCEMGFYDRSLNAELLKKHEGDVNACVGELLNISDNTWHQTRH